MEPKSKPCIFLGYSPTQNAYKCLEPHTHKIYISRHVLFDKNQHPQFVPSQPTRQNQNLFPLFVDVQPPPVHVPSSMTPVSLPTPILLEGAHAIAVSSSGNSPSHAHIDAQPLD
jgi:hypothetical protein